MCVCVCWCASSLVSLCVVDVHNVVPHNVYT